MGLGSLEVNSYLMAAAQSQADYLAATYVISSGENGHVGVGGSNASDRAYAFGYGDGKAITVSENWAGTGSMTAEELVYSSFWADYAHQNTMLDGWGTHYVDVGVGVAYQEDSGVTYYVLDVGVVNGDDSYTPSNTTSVDPAVVNGTAAVTYVFKPLVTSTPDADGSVWHTVRYGETIDTIAKSYGVTSERIRDLNNMAEGWTLINEGNTLLIYLPGSVTQSAPQTTETPSDITSTPTTAITFTPKPKITNTTIATLAITTVPTTTPIPDPISMEFNSRTLGMILMIICGIGLVGFVGFTFLKPGK